jgi:hypothetical protein
LQLLTLRFRPNALVITNTLNEQEVKELEDINDSVISNTSAIFIAEDAKPLSEVDEEQEKDMEKENDTYL